MVTNLQTPGVYIEEISTRPPSVVEVETAIPAFIGYTAKGPATSTVVAQISSLLDYEEIFGKARATTFDAREDGTIAPLESQVPTHSLWYAINLYFNNGGGRCYVISVDNETSELDLNRFRAGLEALRQEVEPTLIVMPETVSLPAADFNSLNEAALKLCHDLQDRFAILDVQGGQADNFRSKLAPVHLKYGAAYHPYLQTTLPFVHDETTVTVAMDGGPKTLADIKLTHAAIYNLIKKNLSEQCVVLPPSAAVAGIYARVDRDIGVWKAPANVSVMSVVGPVTTLTADEQANLNVDQNSGKSINVIRSFTGKGTLVWGARTLAGNDNEWRYVNVRRLLIMMEVSCKKACGFVVFEPNEASTWLKVKAMFQSYLLGLWRRGALQGNKPEEAFFVNVGLGTTMTAEDVLEGRMIIEIGVAVIRPAEFIIVRFHQKLFND